MNFATMVSALEASMLLSVFGLASKKLRRLAILISCITIVFASVINKKQTSDMAGFDFGLFVIMVIIFNYILSIIIGKLLQVTLDKDTNDDVNVDTAKENNRKYQDELIQKQKDYLKTISDKIKNDSKRGYKSVETANLRNEFMTYEFMMEMKQYFEQKGFTVKEESNKTGPITSWLRISWE